MYRVFMVFAVAVSSALAQFVCPDMFGMFRHPDNCSIFFICNYGMAHERACPPSLLFDTDLGICRHSSDVQCLHQTQLLTEGFTCSSTVGLFADPFSCEHFYLCANGHPYRQRCPFGLIFDGVVCNWKYDRSCLLQDRIWLGESTEDQINGRPKDPQRPSKIDIQKMPKMSTQQIPDGSDPHSTPDEMTIRVRDLTIEEGKSENGRQGKIPTVTPVGRDISRTEDRPKVVSTLENKKEHNSTKPQESVRETTKIVQQFENVKQHLNKIKSHKVQNPWKELQRQRQEQRQQQWMLQRQRQWRLQQRWTRQQQRRLQQEQRKMKEQQQQWRLQQEQRKLREQQRTLQEERQENATVNESFNQTTVYTRLMAGKVTAEAHGPTNDEKISRWWRTSWTQRVPRSEKTTSSPWLFPVRHKTQLPAIIAIQAFDNSKAISNTSISGNFSNFDGNDISKNYSGNIENPSNSTNNVINNNKSISTNNNSIDNDRNTGAGGNNISTIYNITHVINNGTNNTNSTDNNNTDTDNNIINNNHNTNTDDNNIRNIYNNTHVINNVTNNTRSTNNSSIKNNLNVTINIDIISYNATNTNLTASSLMNDINTAIFNSSNDNDISIGNNTILGRIYDSTTDDVFVFRTSENSYEKTEFSKPFTKKETIEKLTTQNFLAYKKL